MLKTALNPIALGHYPTPLHELPRLSRALGGPRLFVKRDDLTGLALGGKTYKLKFGHHGANHPVKDLESGRIGITSQNHGFCVDVKTLPPDDIEVIHLNLNDQSVEGLRHKKYPLFSIQYHPEACPGPNDAKYLFQKFIDLIEGTKAAHA